MKKFDLKKAILENKATFHSSLNEAEGLTPLQDYVYQYEIEISGEDQAQEFLDDIKKLNTPDDVYDYYAYERDWQGSMDDDLENIYRQVKRKFSKLGEGYDEFKRADKGSKDVTAKDKGEEEVYGAGVKKGEEIEKKKLKEESKIKKSDLKAKIKEMIVAEYEKDVDVTDENPEKEVDFLAELEEMLNEGSPMNDPRTKQVIQMLIDMDVDGETMEYILRQVGMDDQMSNQLVNYPAEYAASLNEADETEKDTAEVDTTDVTVDDTETTDVETTAEVDPNVKAVQDSLTQAQAAAQALGDKKLIDQIGNTITFFTRAHVVEKPKGAVTEADEIELSNMQYVLDWWEELPFEKKKEIFHKEHEAEDDINRFRMNESMFPMLNKILK
jgi:hypothetical protein